MVHTTVTFEDELKKGKETPRQAIDDAGDERRCTEEPSAE